ncbi:hypothetical protein Taro_008497 [Colocasia esculenta]|uniref:Uncharacterized protein n=1 Tax=Colocasia esculenta TaxID=4460 RepID=A0A843U1A7_COLES|nr:hypothetical protein [Colocasia esculenta]
MVHCVPVPSSVEVDLCYVEVCGVTFYVLSFYSSSGCLLYSYWTRVQTIPYETSVRSWEADLDMGLTRHKYPGPLQLVFSPVVRLCGPADWAQSAHRFSACERDRGVCHVLNTTALVVAFYLPTEMRSSSTSVPCVAH